MLPKRRLMAVALLAMATLALAVLPACAQEQQFADLGRCPLVSGQAIEDCRIGYRLVGTLAADKSNAVLLPTWAGGSSEQTMSALTGPGKTVDSSKYFVIVVDSLANGVSSSPSNSTAQRHMAFPVITIADMVNVEHTLVTKVLGLTHLHAVVGQSMGGMQAFEWMVDYPDFMDKAVPIVGSPRLGSYTLVLGHALIDAIKRNPAWDGGNYKVNPLGNLEAELGLLTLWTPEWIDKNVPRDSVAAAATAGTQGNRMDANDTIRQYEAMMALDVSKQYGSMEAAAKRVKAKVLIIQSLRDHTVTPWPALAFAKLLGIEPSTYDSECGHLIGSCKGAGNRSAGKAVSAVATNCPASCPTSTPVLAPRWSARARGRPLCQ